MDLYVVKGEFPLLFGCPWLHPVELDWQIIKKLICLKTINQTTVIDTKGEFISKYAQLFSDDLGKMKGFQAKIDMKEDAISRHFKPRPVPIVLKEKVESAIGKLEND